MPKGRRRLQEVLNLNNKAWKKWLRSPIVKLSWVELWNSCLKDIEVESKEYKRGQNLAAIKRRILLGEVGGRRKYSAPYREKDGWGEAEHLACFLFWVKYENEVDRDGMFFYKPWMPDNQKYAIVWGLLNWIREIHSPSRISLPGGGTAIFGTKRGKERCLEMPSPANPC